MRRDAVHGPSVRAALVAAPRNLAGAHEAAPYSIYPKARFGATPETCEDAAAIRMPEQVA